MISKKKDEASGSAMAYPFRVISTDTETHENGIKKSRNSLLEKRFRYSLSLSLTLTHTRKRREGHWFRTKPVSILKNHGWRSLPSRFC